MLKHNSQRPNVVELGKYFPPQYFGGIETMTELSARALADEYNLTVICHSTTFRAIEEDYGAYRLVRCGTQLRSFSQPVSLSMGLELRKAKPDLIHFHAPNFWGALMVLLFSPKAVLVVSHHHDVEGRTFLKKLLSPLYYLVLRRARTIIVNSLKNAKMSRDLPSETSRIVPIPHGLDKRDYVLNDSEIADVREKRRIEFGDNIVVGFIGRFVWYKGLSILLQAIAHVPNVSLVLIGEGPLSEELKNEARTLGISGRVHFLGTVPQSEKVRYLYMMDMLALPSTHVTEAFGISQLEALMCARPVISTKLPTGVSDVNIDCVTGITVPPLDVTAMRSAIDRLANDSGLRQKYGAAGRERVLRFFSERNYIEKLRAEVANALQRSYQNESHSQDVVTNESVANEFVKAVSNPDARDT